MGGDCDCLGGRQPSVQFIGEQQIGELGLCISAYRAVAVFPLQVIEADSAVSMRGAADGDHPGAWGAQQPVEQQTGQREVAKVIGAELEFEIVFGEMAGGDGHNAGVVDEDIDGVATVVEDLSELMNRSEISEIEREAFELSIRMFRANAVGGTVSLGEVAAGEDDVCAGGGEFFCDVEAGAGVGAGDDGEASGLRGYQRSSSFSSCSVPWCGKVCTRRRSEAVTITG